MINPNLSFAALIAAWAAVCAPGSAGAMQRDRSERPASIASHFAGLSIEPLSRIIECTDTMVVRYRGGDPDSAFLRLHPAYVPVSMSIEGEESAISFASGKWRWKRGGRDTVATLIVVYRGRVDFPSAFSRVDPDRAVLRAEEVLPWGEGAIDSGRLSVTVPAAWEVVGPGSRLPGRRGGGGAAATRTEAFGWDAPIATVGWICAGDYVASGGPGSGGTTSLFRIPRNGTAGDPRDTGIVALGDSLLAYYGRIFVPYRFDRLDIVEVDDWVAGGTVLAIAAPSFIMVKRTAFETDDRYNRVETILPHEVAHQWWMGTVFPAPRAVALLSEGLCEYSSILYAGATGHARSRDTLSRSPLLRPLISRVRRGTAIPLDTSVDIRAVLTQYLKGAYVHHMLRGRIGDERFHAALALFAARFREREAGIDDYRTVAEEASGLDLRWFFDQWVRGKGLPALRAYNVRSARAGDGWTVTGRLRVAGYERYTALVTLEARGEGGNARAVAGVGLDSGGTYRNDVPFAIPCRVEPSTVVVDPDGDLLLMRKLPPKLSDLRDPGEALMVVGGGDRREHYRRLASADSSRLARQGWEVAIVDDSTATLGDLQRDRLIVYGRPEDNRIAADLRGSLPFVVDGDSAAISGETVRDSSLGLIQAGMNPWFDDGVVVWIQPFGASANPELRPFDDSWALVRGAETVHAGTWEVVDEAMTVRVRPEP